MFKKNKEKLINIEPVQQAVYSSWSNDLGFLEQCINDRIQICIKFDLVYLKNKLGNTGFINNKDIEERVIEITDDVFAMLSKRYTNYLTTNYFNTEEYLKIHIIEVVKFNLSTEVMKLNNNTIAKINSEKFNNSIAALNKKI